MTLLAHLDPIGSLCVVVTALFVIAAGFLVIFARAARHNGGAVGWCVLAIIFFIFMSLLSLGVVLTQLAQAG